MIRLVIILVLTTVGVVQAQVDDLADDPWNVPQWDALQIYRDAPICLRCARPTELTSLPGINRATASRIRRAVDTGVASIEALADSACLSVDQRIILLSATTLACTCGTWFESARARMRSVSTATARPDLQTRLDITTQTGRIGGLVRAGPYGDLAGGWASIRTGTITVHLGDLAMQTGLGIVHGGGGGFGRGPLSRARTVGTDVRLRPWTSTWQEFGQRGVGIHIDDTLASTPVQAAGYWSRRRIGGREEATSSVALTVNPLPTSTVGITLQHLAYDRPLRSTAISVMPDEHRVLGSVLAEHHEGGWRWTAEVAIDDSLRPAAGVVSRMDLRHGRLIGAIRWSHADLRNPYAAPISSGSGLGNESGLLVGLQWRQNGWAVEGSFDIHRRHSRAYGSPLPSRGFDVLLDGERRLSSMASINVRLRHEYDVDGWRPPEQSTTIMVQRSRSTVRGEISMSPIRGLRVRARGDLRYATWDRLRQSMLGALAYIDVRWSPAEDLAILGRHTVFSSPGIDAAPYTLESPLTGYLRTIAGSGNGSRQFLSIRYSPTPWVTGSGAVIHEHRNGTGHTSGALQVDVRIR